MVLGRIIINIKNMKDKINTIGNKPAEESVKKWPQWIWPVREIIIKTDWANILIEKNETSGVLELSAILSKILQTVNK